MRVRATLLAAAFVVTGCAWLQAQSYPRPSPRDDPASRGWATVETDRATFAGFDVFFRLLVGAKDGGIVFDRRFVPNTNLELRAVQDCDAGTPLPFIFADYFPPPPSPSDLVELHAGEWFGTEEQFPI